MISIFLFLLTAATAIWFRSAFVELNQRSYELERQDKGPVEGRYEMYQYEDMMLMLFELNKIDPAGYNATLSMFDKLKESPKRILEIGFGRGDFSIELGAKYPNAKIVGIDAHEFSVKVAQENLAARVKSGEKVENVIFEHRPVAEMVRSSETFDVITTTFVNHHIYPDENFLNFLLYVKTVGKKAFIFNDFHRTFRCYYQTKSFLEAVRWIGESKVSIGMHMGLQLFPSSPLLKLAAGVARIIGDDRPGRDLFVDGGILSVARSFSHEEMSHLLEEAGYPPTAVECVSDGNMCRTSCLVHLS